MIRKLTAVGLVLTAVLLSGAECDDRPGGKPGGKATIGPTVNPPALPRPNPDHGPKTPNPGAGDPNPHDPVHQYVVWATWSPAADFVHIDWVIGTDNGPALGYLERSGGHFSKNGTARRSGTVYIEVNAWSGTRQFPIDINCWVTEDGKEVARDHATVQTKPRGDQGVTCTAPD